MFSNKSRFIALEMPIPYSSMGQTLGLCQKAVGSGILSDGLNAASHVSCLAMAILALVKKYLDPALWEMVKMLSSFDKLGPH